VAESAVVVAAGGVEHPEEWSPAIPIEDDVAPRDWGNTGWSTGNRWRGAGCEAGGNAVVDVEMRGWRGGVARPGTNWCEAGLAAGGEEGDQVGGADPGEDWSA
jgi:hypothetical protein